MTPRSTAFVLFLVIGVAAGIAVLGTNPPRSKPIALAPSTAPSAWPDYSVNGPGFVTPAGPQGELITLGYRLVTQTFAIIGPEAPDPAKRFAGNNLSCQNCHLDGGTKRSGLPLVGAFRKYPWISSDGKHEVTLRDRLNECMTHSMNGKPLPHESREMDALVAFLKFIGDPAAEPSTAMPHPPVLASAARGAEVYARVCAACHQPDGLGRRLGSVNDGRGYRFPPLWGSDSFNASAGMNYVSIAARFVWRNMPRGVDPIHPQLDLQQAWDVAAFLHAQPRPPGPAAR
ncbi:MAG: c-type cytochrome [Reyranella sp.]|nr:c-type cytochrome [Reyranella sp.]